MERTTTRPAFLCGLWILAWIAGCEAPEKAMTDKIAADLHPKGIPEQQDCPGPDVGRNVGRGSIDSNMNLPWHCMIVAEIFDAGSRTVGTASGFWGPHLHPDRAGVRDGDFDLYTEGPMIAKRYEIDTKSFNDAAISAARAAAAADPNPAMQQFTYAQTMAAKAGDVLDKRIIPDVRLRLQHPPDGGAPVEFSINDIVDNPFTKPDHEIFNLKGFVEVTQVATQIGETFGYRLDLTWTSRVSGLRTFYLRGTVEVKRSREAATREVGKFK